MRVSLQIITLIALAGSVRGKPDVAGSLTVKALLAKVTVLASLLITFSRFDAAKPFLGAQVRPAAADTIHMNSPNRHGFGTDRDSVKRIPTGIDCAKHSHSGCTGQLWFDDDIEDLPAGLACESCDFAMSACDAGLEDEQFRMLYEMVALRHSRPDYFVEAAAQAVSAGIAPSMRGRANEKMNSPAAALIRENG